MSSQSVTEIQRHQKGIVPYTRPSRDKRCSDPTPERQWRGDAARNHMAECTEGPHTENSPKPASRVNALTSLYSSLSISLGPLVVIHPNCPLNWV